MLQPFVDSRFARLARREDARLVDGACFDLTRQRLLNEADRMVDPFQDSTGDLEVRLEAVATRAYCRTQQLWWQIHVGMDRPSPQLWYGIAQTAEAGFAVLRRVTLQPDRWADTTIRLHLSEGTALVSLGQRQEAIHNFLAAASLYRSAIRDLHLELGQARLLDAQDALYELIDQAADFVRYHRWVVTSSALIKDMAVGSHSAGEPLALSAQPGLAGDVAIDLDFPSSFMDEQWWSAMDELGGGSALFDIVITGTRVHTWLHLSSTALHESVDLQRVTYDPKVGAVLSPAGGVLWPTVDLKWRHVAAQASKWHDQHPSSEFVNWIAHDQMTKISLDSAAHECVWTYEWASQIVLSEHVQRTVYEQVFDGAVSFCLSKGITHLIVCPDGTLSALPLHLLMDGQDSRLCEKLSVSYVPTVMGLLECIGRASFDLAPKSRAVIVADPSGTVGLAGLECSNVAQACGSSASLVAPEQGTTKTIAEAARDAEIFHFTGHAVFDWADSENSYLVTADGGRLTLDDLRGIRLRPGGLAFLSACHTGGGGTHGERATTNGIVGALLEAGASTVISTMWPTHSAAAALVSTWFYRAWLGEGLGRLASLNHATERLRTASLRECEETLGHRLYMRSSGPPFSDEGYWGAFVLSGAW